MGFFRNILDRFRGRPVDWDELEEMLIRADLGVPLALQLLDTLRRQGDELTAETVVTVARSELLALLPPASPSLRPFPSRPKVILVVGVNGTGKTTSIAKLAHLLKARGHSVLLAAGDTFRAAAIEQLAAWGDRLGVEVVRGQYQGDPAALCHDAYAAAASRNVEFLIADTAGRLHTKHNLMQELAKVKRILGRHDDTAPHETWIVVDATTGSNALTQARQFHEAVGLTGAIVTKLDGSGRGGSVVALQHELSIPTRYIGTGEKPEDFHPFDPQEFVEKLL